MRSLLVNHILPYFKNIKLQKINSRIIEKWLLKLREKPGKAGNKLSHTTINHCLTCLKIMLKEAVRLEYLHKNPAAIVLSLKEDPIEKSILTVDEVKKLFSNGALQEIWGGDLQHYTLNLLGASTGMRMGEVRGLQNQYVHDNYVDIRWSWGRYGLQRPKRNSMRQIPIPRRTSVALKELVSMSPYQEPTDLVFFGDDRYEPVKTDVIYKSLYTAFANIGINEEDRRKRNISFHCWRHFYNSLMRGKIHDAKLRRLTGHKTIEMTEHYTHFQLSDFNDVLRIQEQYFS